MVRNMTSYRELARNRDFTILWTGETISELGSTMSLFVFPLIGYHLTGSTLVSALLEAAGLFGLVRDAAAGRASWPTATTAAP